MTQEELIFLLSGEPKGIVDAVKKLRPQGDLDPAKQYDPKQHDILDATQRPNKQIKNDKGETEIIKVNRIPIALQKMIVKRAASFLCGNPIQLEASPVTNTDTNLVAVLNKTWEDNKLDYKSKAIAKKMMSETECAELWFTEPASPEYWENTPIKGSKNKLRMRLLAGSLGDTLYPVFDQYGDMIAFGRGYKIKVGDRMCKAFTRNSRSW